MYKIGNWFLLETGANYEKETGNFPRKKPRKKYLLRPKNLKETGSALKRGLQNNCQIILDNIKRSLR
jgi:hypothetical protein